MRLVVCGVSIGNPDTCEHGKSREGRAGNDKFKYKWQADAGCKLLPFLD